MSLKQSSHDEPGIWDWKKGGNVGKALSDLERTFECEICSGFFVAPQYFVQCGHTFCSECIRRALEVKRLCPKCNSSANNTDLRAARLIDAACFSFLAARKALVDASNSGFFLTNDEKNTSIIEENSTSDLKSSSSQNIHSGVTRLKRPNFHLLKYDDLRQLCLDHHLPSVDAAGKNRDVVMKIMKERYRSLCLLHETEMDKSKSFGGVPMRSMKELADEVIRLEKAKAESEKISKDFGKNLKSIQDGGLSCASPSVKEKFREQIMSLKSKKSIPAHQNHNFHDKIDILGKVGILIPIIKSSANIKTNNSEKSKMRNKSDEVMNTSQNVVFYLNESGNWQEEKTPKVLEILESVRNDSNQQIIFMPTLNFMKARDTKNFSAQVTESNLEPKSSNKKQGNISFLKSEPLSNKKMQIAELPKRIASPSLIPLAHKRSFECIDVDSDIIEIDGKFFASEANEGSNQWICHKCTLINSIKDSNCQACDTFRRVNSLNKQSRK